MEVVALKSHQFEQLPMPEALELKSHVCMSNSIEEKKVFFFNIYIQMWKISWLISSG